VPIITPNWKDSRIRESLKNSVWITDRNKTEQINESFAKKVDLGTKDALTGHWRASVRWKQITGH
jgi:hypothetical protein